MTPLRILLDENLDEAFADHLEGFQVQTVRQRGWSGMVNGDLLDRAQADFDVFVTADKNLPHQTNIRTRNIAVAVLDVLDLQLESAFLRCWRKSNSLKKEVID